MSQTNGLIFIYIILREFKNEPPELTFQDGSLHEYKQTKAQPVS